MRIRMCHQGAWINDAFRECQTPIASTQAFCQRHYEEWAQEVFSASPENYTPPNTVDAWNEYAVDKYDPGDEFDLWGHYGNERADEASWDALMDRGF